MKNVLNSIYNELLGRGRFLGNCRSSELICIPVLLIGLTLIMAPSSFNNSHAFRDLHDVGDGKYFVAGTFLLAGISGLLGIGLGIYRVYATTKICPGFVEKWCRLISAVLSCGLFVWMCFKFYFLIPGIFPNMWLYIYAALLSVWSMLLVWNRF